jgi:TonB family protein
MKPWLRFVGVVFGLAGIGIAQDVFPTSLESFEYPILAIQARISGTVELQVVINPDGVVTEVRRIGGHTLLARAAEVGIKRWTFSSRRPSREQVGVIVLPLKVTFILEGETEYRPRSRLRYVYPDQIFIIAENMHWQPSAQMNPGGVAKK